MYLSDFFFFFFSTLSVKYTRPTATHGRAHRPAASSGSEADLRAEAPVSQTCVRPAISLGISSRS